MQFSTRVRNARLDAFESAIGTGPALEIWSGALPGNCAAADAGTLLASATLPSDWMAAASSGSKAKSGTWQDSAANANGLGRHYRIRASDAAVDAQGLVSMPWAASTAVQVGQQMHNGGNVYVVTTGGTTHTSGGPTGTGTGISDGTVTWNYVGPVEMTIDNVDIAVGQQVTVTGFTLTEGGA
jgi:hypothetical protein